MLDLKNAAAARGLPAEVVSITGRTIPGHLPPAIAHMGHVRGRQHYVVVVSTSDAGVTAIDGTTGGMVTLPYSMFNRAFTGHLLVAAGFRWNAYVRPIIVAVVGIEALATLLLAAVLFRRPNLCGPR